MPIKSYDNNLNNPNILSFFIFPDNLIWEGKLEKFRK